jgi:hypothetical protein
LLQKEGFMSYSVQRGVLYQAAPEIPGDLREKILEGRWWNGSRLFVYEIVSPQSPPNYYVVSFSLFERFLHALCKIARKDYLGNKVRDLTQTKTIRCIDHAELRRLPGYSTPPSAPSLTSAPKNPSPSRMDDKPPAPVEGPKIDLVPSRQERVVKYIPFNQWPLTEIDQRAFNIIYQRLIDPNSDLVFKSCPKSENPDFVFVKIDRNPYEYLTDIRSQCYDGNLPNQAFYLISTVLPIDKEQLPFEPKYFSVCLVERANRYGRFQPTHPVIDWESSSKEVQHQAALFLLRIFNFSIQSINSIPVIAEEKQKLAYTVIGCKGFSRLDEENINRLSQRILGHALKVERGNGLVHFAVAKVEDARREAKDPLYLTLPYYLVTTTVRVNESHFNYDTKWTEKVSLCKPGSNENIVNWDDPESVRQVAMLFLRIYQVSLVSFGTQKAVA